jgi:hypothetical protein
VIELLGRFVLLQSAAGVVSEMAPRLEDKEYMLRVLLATHHLANWSGSELVTLELAEELDSSGHSVDVLAAYSSGNFVERWKPPSVGFYSKLLQVPPLSHYDIVYCHHSMLARLFSAQPDEAIYGKERPVFVYNHLSPYERFEKPAGFSEALMADLILANSPETADEVRSFGEDFASVKVMPNPAPKSFAGVRRQRTPGRPKRLLVVSNHLPPEAMRALDILSSHGIDVRRVGLPEKPRRLVPQDILDADLVMTIGKTVQYALRAACPVYIYDHFGGPGWLTTENFEKAESTNFSGRDTPQQKTAEQIVDEIIDIPETAVEAVAQCPERFCLESWSRQFVELAGKPRDAASLASGMKQLSRQMFRCEENVLLHLDAMYDHAHGLEQSVQEAEAYRIAYTVESARSASLLADAESYHVAYQTESARSASLVSEVDRYRLAYETEAARNASLLADAEQYHIAYQTESVRSASLISDIGRFRVAYETEAARNEALIADAERFHTAFRDECTRSAELEECCHKLSKDLDVINKDNLMLRDNISSLHAIISNRKW